jgi:hypothetical protein
MEYQEREQLGHFLQGLTQARLEQKDRDAEAMIREACAAQPDAAYLLVQRAMLMEHGLAEARATIARLQSELGAGRSSRPFLADNNAWGSSPSRPAEAPFRPAAQAMPPQPPMAAAPVSPPQAATAPWGGSLLGTVASTALGVAAGSFLFQGLGNVFGGHHAATPSPSPAVQPLADAQETVTDSRYDVSDASAGGLDDLGPGGDDWS